MVLQFAGLLSDERGLTATEYALIASMVSIAILGGVLLLADGVRNQYGMIANQVINHAP